MGIVAFEILYGLFLFAVMSSSRRNRGAADLYADAPAVQPPRVALAEPVERSTPEPTEREPAKVEPAPAPTVKDVPPPPAPRDTPKSPSPPAAKSRRKKAANKKKKTANDSDTTVARAPSPRPVAAPPKVQATIAPLGPLIDPLHDCLVKSEPDGLTISVPPGLHIFDVLRDVDAAPRALADVNGDFLAEVRVPGEIRPGSAFLKGLNFTFQGAGLLLWQDKGNYVRFERTSLYAGDRLHRVFVESFKDGKPGKTSFRNVREGPVALRLERKGRDLIYSYSSDGKTWIKLDQAAVNYPANVAVGISASNASPRPLEARFSNFSLRQ